MLLLTALWFCQPTLQAQTYVMTDCLEAFSIDLPLNFDEFEQDEAFNLSEMPVLRYLRDDQYTLWYRFEAQQSGTLQYAVWTTNRVDRFQSVLYKYNGDSFCRDLVDGKVQAVKSTDSEHMADSKEPEAAIITNQFSVEKGEDYYLAVLSLNPDYCGHLLALEFNDVRIRIHAMNKPCYDFATIDFNLDEAEMMVEPLDDPQLKIDVQAPELSLSNTEPPAINKENTSDNKTAASERDSLSKLTPKSVSTEQSQPDLREMKPAAGDKVRLEEVYFYNNTYAFREDSESQLEELYRFLESNPNVQIEIGGHTSGNTANIKPNPNFKKRGKAWRFKGSSEKLSSMRAEAVKNYLEDRGIDSKRLRTRGYGNAQRIVERPTTPAEHRKNMRVEITVISVD